MVSIGTNTEGETFSVQDFNNDGYYECHEIRHGASAEYGIECGCQDTQSYYLHGLQIEEWPAFVPTQWFNQNWATITEQNRSAELAEHGIKSFAEIPAQDRPAVLAGLKEQFRPVATDLIGWALPPENQDIFYTSFANGQPGPVWGIYEDTQDKLLPLLAATPELYDDSEVQQLLTNLRANILDLATLYARKAAYSDSCSFLLSVVETLTTSNPKLNRATEKGVSGQKMIDLVTEAKRNADKYAKVGNVEYAAEWIKTARDTIDSYERLYGPYPNKTIEEQSLAVIETTSHIKAAVNYLSAGKVAEGNAELQAASLNAVFASPQQYRAFQQVLANMSVTIVQGNETPEPAESEEFPDALME